MIITPKISKAIQFATAAHAGQFRDDGKTPYITHPEKVAEIISTVTNDEDLICAAWLHDTVEDTDTTIQDLQREFGDNVAALVWEVTHEGDKTHGYYFPHLESREGIMLKFADRLHNLSDMEAWSSKQTNHYLKKSKFWASEPKEQK